MSDIAIRCEGLSKQYRIGQQERYKALRDVLTDAAAAPFRRLGAVFRNGNGVPATRESPLETRNSDLIWALDDISFEVKRGEVVGVIGRNGAGKSTLLKILSRITKPTRGHAEIHGRIGSLLEVGTGFHPELTGRENIYLNGAILGMRKAEIDRKFDEIVAFAEVDKFIDTVVKRYSTGMYVRLAFAVAAHMDTEILLVDEVLAVGDAAFQRKCLGKMSELSHHGRTVLFVTHNERAVRRLCNAGILIESGRLSLKGEAAAVIEAYAGRFQLEPEVTFRARPDHPCITRVTVDPEAIKTGDLVVDVAFQSPYLLNPPIVGITVSSISGTPVFGSNPRFHPRDFDARSLTSGVCRMIVRNLPLSSGQYRLSIYLGDWQTEYDQKLDALAFRFRPNALVPFRPNSENIGHLDWEAEWKVSEGPS